MWIELHGFRLFTWTQLYFSSVKFVLFQLLFFFLLQLHLFSFSLICGDTYNVKYLICNDWEQNVLSGLEVLGILFKSELGRSDTISGTGFILYIVKVLKINSFKKYKRIKKNKKSFKTMSSSPTGALQRCSWRGFSLLIMCHGAKAGL